MQGFLPPKNTPAKNNARFCWNVMGPVLLKDLSIIFEKLSIQLRSAWFVLDSKCHKLFLSVSQLIPKSRKNIDRYRASNFAKVKKHRIPSKWVKIKVLQSLSLLRIPRSSNFFLLRICACYI